MSSAKPVLISGAGPGGLLLAQSLRSHRIPFELYERDSARSSRGQGYRLRISVDGINALEQALEPAHYVRFRAGCTELGAGNVEIVDALTMESKPMQQPDGPAGGGDTVGVDRAFLRRTLLEGIEDVVVFGAQVVGY